MSDGGLQQITLTGEETDTELQPPDTFVVCAETGQFILRSRQHDWPHETISVDEWFDPGEGNDGDQYDEYDAEEPVGSWWDITLSYSVEYRFRVPAFTKHQAEEVAKDWKFDATPADSYHVHTDRREGNEIERQELPDDWDPYGGERIHEVLLDD